MPKYIDSHCHLQDCTDINSAISHMTAAGVVGAICNATSPTDWDIVVDLSQKYSCVYGCIGVHLWNIVGLIPGWNDKMREILRRFPTLMVGEVGLDKNHPNMPTQESVFISQMKIACDMARPIFIHCVGAWERMLHILKLNRRNLPPVMIAHSFTGSVEIMQRLASEYDFYFSYSPVIMDTGRVRVAECIRMTPSNRILVESDNSNPAVVVDVIRRIAEIKSIAMNDMADIVYKNTIGILENGQTAQNAFAVWK